jgi:hypothetical protein
MLLRTIALSLALLFLALPAGAVIIDSGDGTANTTAPADDPGWDSVGNRGVHIRDGWILAANHVQAGTINLAGVNYAMVPGTETRLDNGDGTKPDLKVWGVYPHPPLPPLTIRASAAQPTGEVIMIGNGRDRGAATDTNDPTVWVPPPDPPISAKTGYLWLTTRSLRWGTNKIGGEWLPTPNNTVSWFTIFDKSGNSDTTHEAQAAQGDSGGAVFAKNGSYWELMGLMYAVSLWEGDTPESGQQFNSALYGNATVIADLSFYRDQILDLTSIPVPEPGGTLLLASGIAFLLTAGRKRKQP